MGEINWLIEIKKLNDQHKRSEKETTETIRSEKNKDGLPEPIPKAPVESSDISLKPYGPPKSHH